MPERRGSRPGHSKGQVPGCQAASVGWIGSPEAFVQEQPEQLGCPWGKERKKETKSGAGL